MRLQPRSVAATFVAIAAICVAHPAAASRHPLRVYILAGQSNMQGHANISTMDAMADDLHTAPLLTEVRNADGTPRVLKNVWVASLGCGGNQYSDLLEQTGNLTTGFGASTSEIGPELTYGITISRLLGEPVLLIKASWGGRSLHTDFRPPSAGPEQFDDFIVGQWQRRGMDVAAEEAKIRADDGVFYRHTIEYVHRVLADIGRVVPGYDPRQGYRLSGFVWFQGWNDMVDGSTYHERMKPGGYDMYTDLLADFIRDVRKDLAAPKLPFVIGVMGVGGLAEDNRPPQMYFRQAEAAVASRAEFRGNVAAVPTAPFWDDRLDALRQRLSRVESGLDQDARKHPGMTQAERDDARERALAASFTPDERRQLRGASNGDYHYLGSAKILAQIGRALAEATAKLQGRR